MLDADDFAVRGLFTAPTPTAVDFRFSWPSMERRRRRRRRRRGGGAR